MDSVDYLNCIDVMDGGRRKGDREQWLSTKS